MTHTTIKILEEKALQGDAESLYKLGLMYYEGTDSVKKDFGRALAYFENAGLLNHMESMFRLSTMYAQGEGIDPDPDHAHYWFVKWHKLAVANRRAIDQ